MSESTRLSANNINAPPGATGGQSDGEQEAVNQCKQTLGVFTKFVLLRCFGLFLYGLDMLTDVNAAYGDYQAGDELFAYITLGLVFAPGLVYSLYMACEYLVMYSGDIVCLKAPLVIVTSPLLPVWVIIRDLKHILEGLIATVSPKRRPALLENVQKPSKIYLLKFLEAFTEAAPQLLVRLFRLASRNPQPFSDLRTSEIIQICFSVTILSLKVVSTHQQSVTTHQVLEGDSELHSKYRLPWFIQIIAICWWICFLVARFEAMALFSAAYGYWILLVVGLHVVLMFAFQTIVGHKDRLKRIFIYLFGAFVFIFAYVQFNLKSRLKVAVWFPYAVYAIVVFVENSIMLTSWFYYQGLNVNAIVDSLNASNVLRTESMNGSINGDAVSLLSMGGDSNVTFIEGTSTIADIPITGDDLTKHWKLLLFVHYGTFGAGLFFMIVTFCFTSCITGDDDGKKSKSEQHEMEAMNDSNQS